MATIAANSTKRILVVAHDPPLRLSRTALLLKCGYTVESIDTEDAAMSLVNDERFDLLVIGRASQTATVAFSQRLRERYPDLLTLQITKEVMFSQYPSRTTDSQPANVVAAVRELLG